MKSEGLRVKGKELVGRGGRGESIFCGEYDLGLTTPPRRGFFALLVASGLPR